MNLNQLYYFNELVKQHQFSSAAKRLHISQPIAYLIQLKP